MTRGFIACPECENNGRRYILGEIAPTGHILIQRVHGNNGQYRNYTIVGGNDFYLVCDHCGTQVFFRKIGREENEGYNERLSWFYSGTSGSETVSVGTDNGTN